MGVLRESGDVKQSAERSDVPRLSVGLAVYNGEKFVAESIRSILSQTFSDFELIISDNASTDSTGDICREFLSDPRVKYCRNTRNIGGANNENLTFAMSRGELFRLAAHDDLCAPTLFERCIQELDRQPEVVLCYTRVNEIDEQRNFLRSVYDRRGTASSASRRFGELADRSHSCAPTYGVIRSEVLRRTPLQRNFTDSDRILLCELALHGRFHQIDEALFFRRVHSGNQYLDWRERMSWFNPDRVPGSPEFPNWLATYWLWRTAFSVPRDSLTKVRCAGWSLRWTIRRIPGLMRDLTLALLSTMGLHRTGRNMSQNWDHQSRRT